MEQNTNSNEQNENTNTSGVYSYHTFVYPFSLERGKIELNETNGWNKKKIDIEKEYSDYVYYNNEGRRLLYSQEEIVEYNLKIDKEKYKYEIEYVIEEKNTTKDGIEEIQYRLGKYTLPCVKIRLKMYKEKIYLFIIEIENTEYQSEEDIKRINDIGRRIYYPFINKEIYIMGNEEDKYNYNQLCPLKLSLILDKTYILDLSKESKNITNIKELSKLDNKLIPSFVKELLGLNDDSLNDLDSIVDERMLMTCCINIYGNETDFDSKKSKIDILKSNYEFAYCDCKGGCTFQNEALIQNEIERVSYRRWEDFGSYYYITTTGLVNIIKSKKSCSYLVDNAKNIYNEIYFVALLQKMALLYLNKTINFEQSNAYKLYNDFSDLIDFEIITTQIQGIEMFNQMRETLGNDVLKEKIQEKISRIHNIEIEKHNLELEKHNKELEEKTDKLTIITSILSVIVTLATSLSSFASIIYSDSSSIINNIFFGLSAFVSLIIFVWFSLKFRKIIKK